MAPRDPKDSSLPAVRPSPGEAVFQRLRAREIPVGEHRREEAGVIRPKPPRPLAAPKAAEEPVALESELQDQLKELAAALVPQAPVPETPASVVAPGAEVAKPAVGADAPRRSAFAPDPVRQRTYYDLRHRPPDLEAARALPQARRTPRRQVADDASVRQAPVPERAAPVRRGPPETRAHSRGLDARTLSVAALIGIGVGFAGLTAVGHVFPSGAPGEFSLAGIVPMSGPAPAPETTPEEPLAEVVAEAPTKDQERVIAEVEQIRGDPVEGRTESGVFPAVPDRVIEATQPEMTVAAPPAPAAARAAHQEENFDGGAGLLSYAPLEPQPSFPPDRTNADGSARNGGPGTARVTTSVNMRSGPDNDASVVAVLAAGTVVQIESCDFWCTVVAGDRRGYVYRKFVGR